LYKGFLYFFTKYWPRDLQASYYFLTETVDVNSDFFTTIKTGKGQWSDRLRQGLQSLPENYIIYMQEDMWMNHPVNKDVLQEVIDFALAHKPKLFKLNSSEVFVTKPTHTLIGGLRVAEIDNEKSDFLMSHQVSIWDKDFLINQLPPNEHPWRNERRGTKRMRKLNETFYHVDLFSENGKLPVNDNPSLEHRSAYFTVSQNAMLNEQVLQYIKTLRASGDKEMMEYADQLQYNLDHQLTHDGKPKPRKEDVFKKIKKWLGIGRR
jgi:hypothetical protein